MRIKWIADRYVLCAGCLRVRRRGMFPHDSRGNIVGWVCKKCREKQ